MRIISTFADFYDGCSYGCGDNTVVFERENDRISKDDKDTLSNIYRDYYGSYNSYDRTRIYYNSIVIIGEIIIPYIGHFSRNFINSTITLDVLMSKEDIQNSFYLLNHHRPRMIEHLNKNHIDFYNKVREVTKEPLIAFTYHSDSFTLPLKHRMDGLVHISPNLKRMGLSKVLEPHMIVQEIEMFINKLNSQEKIVQFTDKEKLVQNGFDNNSFKG